MSDSKGLYAVPENIRKMKPRGTMVKKIKGHYYVYRMQHIKDEKTGKWKIKSLGIIGKIVEGRGFIQPKTRFIVTRYSTSAYCCCCYFNRQERCTLSAVSERVYPVPYIRSSRFSA